MKRAGTFLRARLWPRVPDAVHDDLTLLRYCSLRAQVPMLYVMLVLLILVTLYGTPVPADPLVAWGTPVAMIGIITARVIIWYRRRNEEVTVAAADRMIRVMTISSCGVGALASSWCVYSWASAPPDIALYYPLIMAMGALSAAFCVSNIRLETVLNLSLCLFPISGALMLSNESLDRAAGGSIAVACLFLIRLVLQQHRRLVAQLLLERQMRELAHTDELTGLLNRRALMANATTAVSQPDGCALALIDLDGFKRINDRHGHATGDAVLVEVARRMRLACPAPVNVARIGGDEFALLWPAGDAADLQTVVDRVLATLAAPIMIDRLSVRIGASAGLAGAAGGAENVVSLFATADHNLYAAKHIGRREHLAESSIAA